ncbi:homoserine O-succinyltransferase MetX [Maricaulis sp.]|uniref:homoserine O-succinyltransferase MetX n=1 Tax=Maricaulis sp. TaxID=1486257 RepID=UPI003A91DE5B
MPTLLRQSIEAPVRSLSASLLCAKGSPARVTGRLTGPDGAPVCLVLGGISADRAVAASHDEPGWWSAQAGPGRALDTDNLRILSFDFLADPVKPFPTTTDQARAILALADAAGISRFSIVGASYGGMIGLALAILAPERVEKLLVISAAHRASAMAKAWRSIQRDTVELDLKHGDGRAGLDLARRLAMTTYRTPIELESRFYDPEPGCRDANGVCAYLEARGREFAERVTPQRFLALSRSMDAHEIDPARIDCPVTYLAVVEDQLVPPEQVAEAARATPLGKLERIHSLYGHDAFLKEDAEISAAITRFIGG